MFSILTVSLCCLLFVCYPPARPGGGPPLGHGWSRAGHDGAARSRSRLVTAGHGWSRRCGLRHCRHGAESPVPGPYRSPRWSRSLTKRSIARPKGDCSARHESSRLLEPLSTAPPSVASLQRRFSAATQRSRRQSKMSQGHIGPLPGSSATPQSAPGSCPGGGQAIGQ